MSTDKSSASGAHYAIARSASVIGAATLCSRILGFIRDVVIARLFGVYIYAQAFVIAFRIPNLFRDVLAEGSANAAIVPVFSEYSLKNTREEFWELANVVLNLLLVLLMALTITGIICSPLIVRMIAPGFIAEPEKLAATITLTRIIFPYILLISLAAYSMAILNSLHHFAVPAFAPCLLNIAIIASAIAFGEGIKGLAVGVLAGGLLQLAVQIPILYKKGFHLRWPKTYRHPAVKAIGLLMLPRLASTSLYQLNNFVDSIFGSLAWIVGEGGVAVLYFSYRLIQFPIGIFSNALSQALLPAFSLQALDNTQERLTRTLSWGVRTVFFVMLPASVGFMCLAGPIVNVLFQGGRFDSYSAQMTASALFFYSLGLFAYGGTKVLQSCFFAMKDTVTPTKIAFFSFLLNIILNTILMFPLKVGGLALATSLSGIFAFLSLFLRLRKRLSSLGVKEIAISFLRILGASAAMGLVCFFICRNTSILPLGKLTRFFSLGSAVIAGIVSYIGFCFVFRVKELNQLWRWLRHH